ncbi:DNA damage checkpoint control protein rad1 [Diplonema papillatum]|nr:DNA damage checkpoint control protein rad1 [Diplonema papillatum]
MQPRTPMTTSTSSAVQARSFVFETLQAKVISRVLSLLLWSKDATCQVFVASTGLRVSMTDKSKSVHGTALIRSELFTTKQIGRGGSTNGINFAVNLGHLLTALGMLGPGPQMSPLALKYPGTDGSLVVEMVDGDHSTSCALAARVWDGETVDFAFSKYDVVLKATVKAEFLKDVVADVEQMGAESVDLSFDREKQSLTFSGGTTSAGTVSIEAFAHMSNHLLTSIDVTRTGSTTLSLTAISHTIKTDYFKEASSKGPSSADFITMRVNAAGLVCLLYHIKSHDMATTCGVECTILPLFRPDKDGRDPLEDTPLPVTPPQTAFG